MSYILNVKYFKTSIFKNKSLRLSLQSPFWKRMIYIAFYFCSSCPSTPSRIWSNLTWDWKRIIWGNQSEPILQCSWTRPNASAEHSPECSLIKYIQLFFPHSNSFSSRALSSFCNELNWNVLFFLNIKLLSPLFNKPLIHSVYIF